MNEEQRKKMLEMLEEIRSDLQNRRGLLMGPLEENHGATAIRCNYCIRQAGHRCTLVWFAFDFCQNCCSLQKLPVDFNKIEGKFPKERLTKFLNNNLQ